MSRFQLELAAWDALPTVSRGMVGNRRAVIQIDTRSYELALVPLHLLADKELRQIVRSAGGGMIPALQARTKASDKIAKRKRQDAERYKQTGLALKTSIRHCGLCGGVEGQLVSLSKLAELHPLYSDKTLRDLHHERLINGFPTFHVTGNARCPVTGRATIAIKTCCFIDWAEQGGAK